MTHRLRSRIAFQLAWFIVVVLGTWGVNSLYSANAKLQAIVDEQHAQLEERDAIVKELQKVKNEYIQAMQTDRFKNSDARHVLKVLAEANEGTGFKVPKELIEDPAGHN